MYLGNRGTRTLFSIEAYHGKMIKNHSFYKKEDEVLLLPGTYFEVTNNFNSGNNLHIIQIKQKRPPHTLLERPFQTQEATSFKSILPVAKQSQGIQYAAPPAQYVSQPNYQVLRSDGVKQILFSNIPGAGRGSGNIPPGYEGLDWEDFQYIEESYAQSFMVSAWKDLFKYSRYIIHNVSGKKKMYICSSKPNETFTIKSMDATVVDRDNSQWMLTGLRSNVKLFTKTVTFHNHGLYQLIDLNFVDIDEMIFTTFNGYPSLAISRINLPKSIFDDLCTALRDQAPSYNTVVRWSKLCCEGRKEVEDEPRPGRPVTETTSDNIEKVRHLIDNDPYLTIDEIQV
ncbi:unnamed protein product, partial [Rotaria socialis]